MKKLKIENICEIMNGYAFKSKQYTTAGIRIIRISNVQKGYIEDNMPVFYPLETEGIEKYMLEDDDLLISLTGNVGRVAVLEKKFLPAALNQRVACLRIKNEIVLKKYLFYMLNSDFFENKCIEAAKGVAQKNISTQWLRKYEIPIYTKDKQLQIVKILDSVSYVIKERKKELRNLDELIQARFVEVFGDPVLNTKNFPILKGDKFFKLSNGKSVPEEKRYKQGIPAYGGNGISWYTDDSLVTDDTLVIGRVGFLSGNVHFASGPIWVTDNAMYISWYEKEKYNLLFLGELMQHINFMRYQDSGDLKKITQKPFMDFAYILPPLELQNQFETFVQQVNKSKFEVQKSLEKTQLLFDSLMQEYFG